MVKPKTVKFGGRLGTTPPSVKTRKLRIQFSGEDYRIEIEKYIRKNPEHVLAVLNEQIPELRQILLDTAKELEGEDPKAREARKWNESFREGLSKTADLMEIFTFLTGIPSIPALAKSDTVMKLLDSLKRILNQLGTSSR